MAFIPALDILQVEMRYTWDGQKVENVLYVRGGSTWNTLQMSDTADMFYDWWLGNLQALQSDEVALTEIYVTDLTTASSPTFTRSGDPGDVGARMSPSLPNNVSLAIHFRTAGRGRSSRGRNYIVGMTEDQVVNSEMLDTEVGAYITAYEVLITAAFPNTGSWIVLSRFAGGAPRVAGLPQTILSVGATDLTVDSQRRRLPGRGT